jgi:hypothetical protein
LALSFWGAKADVSARGTQGVVCLRRHFIDVVVPAEGYMEVQTQVLGGVDVVQYLSVDVTLGL